MTLHVSYASNRFVLHASDRLVTHQTRGGVVPFDPLANKTVVFLARDAYVSIGYTGLAYLDGSPTDQWIAEKLSREEISKWPPTPYGGLGQQVRTGPTPPWFDIGTAMTVLRQELIQAAHRVPPSQRRWLPRLVLSGWQRGKKIWRPILYLIVDIGSGPFYQGYGWSRRHGWERGMFYLDFNPTSHVLERIRAKVEKQLQQARSPDETESLLVDALHTAADNCIGIGKDVLSVLLPPPGARRIRVRYLPNEVRIEEVPGIYNTYTGPVGYSPWIVAPHLLSGPAVLVGSSTIEGPLGDFSLALEGPENVTGVGPIMSITSQQRRTFSSPSRFQAITTASPSSPFTTSYEECPFVLKVPKAVSPGE